LTHWFTNKVRPVRRRVRPKVSHGRFRPQVEPLAERVLPAVTAIFSAAAGQLRVIGDDQANTVVVSRDAAGTIFVNNGAVAIQGDPGATVANTRSIMITGGGGNDILALDETGGALPAASIFGGTGNDTLTGGSGIDFVAGEAGSDVAFLGAGDDTFQWNPGDGSDVVEGQGGRDTMVFNGSDQAEKFDISDSGAGSPFHRIRFTRDVGGITMDLNGVEVIDLNALGGADTVTVNDQTATDLTTLNIDLDSAAGTGFGDNASDSVIVNGTNGNDGLQIASFGTRIAIGGLFPFMNITGEAGLDTLTVNTLGGNDVVDAANLAATNAAQLITLTENGGAGNDTLIGSQGADTFVWNPGDGSDVVDGGENPDTMIFNGSDLPEKFDLSANGSRVRLTRDLGGITMDLGGVETVTVNALGGADAVTVNDLSGTPVTRVNLDLAGVAGSGVGDGQADSVIVNGRNSADVMPVRGNNGTILVDGGFIGGLPYFTVIRAVEAADALRVNGNGGDDTIDASTLGVAVTFTADGGAGNDTIFGSPGNDLVIGGAGTDTASLGAGDDTFVWNPGDGSDVVEGQDGNDLLAFNGSDQAENFVVARNGSRVRLTRDVGTITMDVNGFEGIDLSALGGADTITVNDLSGTGLVKVQVNLASSARSGDGQADNVIVNATNDDDIIQLTAFGNLILVNGLFPSVRITGAEATNDSLAIHALGGNDVVDSSNLPAGLIGLTVDLGAGQTAPRVASVVVNAGAAQRSLVTRIQVTFDQHVTLPANAADAFRLVRQGDGAVVVLSAAVDNTGAGTVVTLVFTGGAVEPALLASASLADGRYTLTVLAGLVSGPNGSLDGDGNGAGGDNFVLAGDPATNGLFRLFGDVSGDGFVNGTDFAQFRQVFGTTTLPVLSPFDVNGDGTVNGADFAEFRLRFGATA
jgi:hypothetical protein